MKAALLYLKRLADRIWYVIYNPNLHLLYLIIFAVVFAYGISYTATELMK